MGVGLARLAWLLISLPCLLAQFACPGVSNCSCSRGVSGDYELLCPAGISRQPALIAQVQPRKYVQLQCTAMRNWEDLSLVSGLEIGPVNSFILRLCPLPGTSFRQLMRSVGIPTTNSLQIQSHGNLSDSLTQKHLENLTEVTQLNLNTNALSSLPEDLFRDMGNLTYLDLRNNNLRIPKTIFRYVPKLDVLELGSNNLTSLEPGIFRNLTKLRLLNLWGNRLTNLTRNVFSDVPNLESIDLNSNHMANISPDIFADLGKLKNVNLYSNEFISLPKGLFLSNPNLEEFQLYSNRRSLHMLPPGLLSNLTKLRKIYLNNNNLTTLPEDLFWGSSGITNLTLQRNLLPELPEQLFRDSTDLVHLDISYNRLTLLTEKIFSTLDKLLLLKMSHNRLTRISPDLLLSQTKLVYLSIDHNRLTTIDSAAFLNLHSLRTVQLSHNELTLKSPTDRAAGAFDDNFAQRSPFRNSILLDTLQLDHNNITEIFGDWRYSMIKLRILDLSYNNISYIDTHELQFVSDDLHLDLSYNRLAHIDLDEIEQLALSQYTNNNTASAHMLENHSVRVRLAGNRITCDCRAYNLVRYFEGTLTPEVRYLIDLDSTGLRCSPQSDFADTPVDEIPSRLLTCRLPSPRYPCPASCHCLYRSYDSAMLVNCSAANLTAMPASLPRLDYAAYVDLDVSHNRLTRLPALLGPGYDQVSRLRLSNNNISAINITILPRNITVLELAGNNLTRLDSDSLQYLAAAPRLERVTLHNNPWTCDCEAKGLLYFLQERFKQVPSLNNVTCSNGLSLSKLTASELCPMSTELIVLASLCIAVLGLLVGGMAAMYYRYQREIKVWLYANRLCLWFVTEEELDRDKLYDAFVSYSQKDEVFVEGTLVPGLENGPTKFKLCLHYRNWIPGDMIPNSIIKSVEESCRTIVVLSPNFLKSEWGKLEFRAAHSQALSEGRARVIVILYGDVGPTEDLDPELRAYLSMNTYVKWGDPWFWDKLRYALPHPPELSKGIPLITRTADTKLDKSELINGSNPSLIADNTPPTMVLIDPFSKIPNGQAKLLGGSSV